MKKQLGFLLILLIVIAAFFIACATAAQPTQAPAIPTPVAKPTEPPAEASNITPLLFLGNKNIAPVVFLDGTTPNGVAVDIVHALAKHLSEPVEIRAMNWTEAQALVARGDADALIQINPTEERKKIYDFSDPLLESHFSIFTRADRMGISGLSSLRGLQVGVESGGQPQRLLEKDPQVQLIIIPNFTEGFRQLNEGSVDAVVVDYRVGSYVLAVNNIRNIRISGEPIESSYSSFAVKKGNTKLLNEINTALHIIKADGTYQKIIDNWQPTEVVFETQAQITARNYLYTILILLVLFLIAGIWMVTIKKELTRRKAAEEKLREQHSTLRGIIDSTDALIFSVDRHYHYTSFNRGHAATMKAIYGAEIETGHSILEYMTVEADRETAKRNLDRGFAGEHLVEEAYSGDELRSRHYFQVSHSPIRTEDGIIGVAVLAQDMTGRKLAEEALRESGREWQTTFNAMTDAVFLLDDKGRIIRHNRAFETYIGKPAGEIDGRQCFEVMHGTAYPFEGCPLEKAKKSRQRESLELKIGSRWFIAAVDPVFSDTGEISGGVHLLIDITGRKLAEEALRESEIRLQGIVHGSPIPQFVIDKNHRVITWNEALEEYTGINAGEILGKSTPWNAFYDKERPLMADLLVDNAADKIPELYPGIYHKSKYVKGAFEGTAFFPKLGKNGAWLYFTTALIRNDTGDILGAVVTFEDITERKEAEEALKRSERQLTDIINFLPDATFVIDKDGRIISWNKALEEMTGTTAVDLLGKGNHEYAIPFYGERRPILIDLIFEEISTIESRYVNVQRSGNILVAEGYVPGIYQGKGAFIWGIATPLYDTEGNIVGAIESIRDITEPKMAQDALARATKKLNILNSTTFSDIQNAIFSLSAYMELEKTVPKDEKLQMYLDKQIQIAKTITESLKFANMYQGLGIKPPAWQNVLQSFLLGISHTDISKLSRSLNVGGLEIYADPLLENVFFTLAENITLHGKTATRISLSFRETDAGLVLVFEDNGEGICSDLKEKIFERKDVGIKGKGLFLTSEILSVTGITIKETGEPGKGARFEILVPKGGYRFTGTQQKN